MLINGSWPTLPQVKAFLAVAEFLHFRAAAAELSVSQPALSTALAGCEEALGTRLVERTTRRVMLTTSGARLLPLARQVLDSVDALVAEAEIAGRPFTGTLRLGVIPTVAPYLLPVLLRELRRHYPELATEVHEERTSVLLDGVHNGRLDVGVLAMPAGGRGLVEIPLYAEDFVLVVPAGHRLAGRSGLDLDELEAEQVLLLDEGHCLRDQALALCRQVGAHRESGTRATSLTTLVQLVAADLGITLLPETALAVETRSRALAAARFAAPAPGRTIGLVYRDSAGRGTEYREIAGRLRRVVGARRLPVRPPQPA